MPASDSAPVATKPLDLLRALERRYDGPLPPRATALALAGGAACYEARRARIRARFFDRMARESVRAIQRRRRRLFRPETDARLDALTGDLAAARRQGLPWCTHLPVSRWTRPKPRV